VELGRGLGDEQGFADRAVGQPAGQQAQYLDLAGGEHLVVAARGCGEAADHGRGTARVEGVLAPVHGPDRPQQFLGVHFLDHVAARAVAQRGHHQAVLQGGGEHEDGRTGMSPGEVGAQGIVERSGRRLAPDRRRTWRHHGHGVPAVTALPGPGWPLCRRRPSISLAKVTGRD
jgi:hypothetical protein